MHHLNAIFHPITCSISLVAEKNSRSECLSDVIHQGNIVRKCWTEIKPYLLWVLGTLIKQSLVLGSESTLQVVVSDVVKLRGVLSGPYLSAYWNSKCSACISGLLKEWILSFPAIKKLKAFLEGEKAKTNKGEEVRRGRDLRDFRVRVLADLRNETHVMAQPLHFH